MNLESYIEIYDNVMPLPSIGSFVKFANMQKFEDCGLGKENRIDKTVRSVKGFSLTDWDCGSKTKIHWCNYIGAGFKSYFDLYCKTHAPKWGTSMNAISTLDVLKYEKGGLYTPHIDHFDASPRILSGILLLNDDYEGGELEFLNPKTGKTTVRVEVQSSRLIIWPSCFLYPHMVKTIKKGTRFSIVAWAS